MNILKEIKSLKNNKRGDTFLFVINIIIVIGFSILLFGKLFGYIPENNDSKNEISSLQIVIKHKLEKDPDLFKEVNKFPISSLKEYQDKSLLYRLSEDNFILAENTLEGDFYELSPEIMDKLGFKQTSNGKLFYSVKYKDVYFKEDEAVKNERERNRNNNVMESYRLSQMLLLQPSKWYFKLNIMYMNGLVC